MRKKLLIFLLILSFKLLANETSIEIKVKKGDSLWNISQKLYLTPFKWREIYNINKDKIKNPNLIYPGQVLKLKEKITQKLKKDEIEVISNLSEPAVHSDITSDSILQRKKQIIEELKKILDNFTQTRYTNIIPDKILYLRDLINNLENNIKQYTIEELELKKKNIDDYINTIKAEAEGKRYVYEYWLLDRNIESGVYYKNSKQGIWSKLILGNVKIKQGDEIRTENCEVDIMLLDKGRIKVKPYTHIKIRELKFDTLENKAYRLVEILEGKVEPEILDKNYRVDFFINNIIFKPKKGIYALDLAGDYANISAIDGAGDVRIDTDFYSIKTGEILLKAKDKPPVISAIIPSQVELDYPPDKVLIPLRQPILTFSKSKNASFYKAQIALDPKFTKIVAQASSFTNTIKTPPLDDGEYYWRVIAFYNESISSLPSVTRFFIIDATPPDIFLRMPDFSFSTNNLCKIVGYISEEVPYFFINRVKALLNEKNEFDVNVTCKQGINIFKLRTSDFYGNELIKYVIRWVDQLGKFKKIDNNIYTTSNTLNLYSYGMKDQLIFNKKKIIMKDLEDSLRLDLKNRNLLEIYDNKNKLVKSFVILIDNIEPEIKKIVLSPEYIDEENLKIDIDVSAVDNAVGLDENALGKLMLSNGKIISIDFKLNKDIGIYSGRIYIKLYDYKKRIIELNIKIKDKLGNFKIIRLDKTDFQEVLKK